MNKLLALAAVALLFVGTAEAQTRSLNFVPTVTIGAAQTTIYDPVIIPRGIGAVTVQGKFVYAAGGTTCKAFLQTSLDNGATWTDVATLAFTTANATKISAVKGGTALAAAYVPTDGALADDTIKDGLIGDRLRVKVISTGTYTGITTLNVSVVAN